MSTLQKRLSGKPQASKAVSDDVRLSYRAVGILNFLLTRHDGWRVTQKSLMRCDDGPEEIRAACAELLQLGYLTRYEGPRGAVVTHVSDTPFKDWSTRNAIQDFSEPVDLHRGVRNDDAISTEEDLTGLCTDDSLIGKARRIAAAWIDSSGRDVKRSKLTGERFRKVEARLREGYTEEDLIEAVRGISLSAWHTGDNPAHKKFDDMELALRNGRNVEKFRDLFRAGGERPSSVVDMALARLDEMGLGDNR